jgi:hypothetical protein
MLLHVCSALMMLRSTCEAWSFASAFAMNVTHLLIAARGAAGLATQAWLNAAVPIASRCARQSQPGMTRSAPGGATVARLALLKTPGAVWAATEAAAARATSAATAMAVDRTVRFMALSLQSRVVAWRAMYRSPSRDAHPSS